MYCSWEKRGKLGETLKTRLELGGGKSGASKRIATGRRWPCAWGEGQGQNRNLAHV